MVKETTSTNLKKKRKTAATESEQVDVYKKVVAFEEKECAHRQSEIDAKLYFELCQDIREMLKEVFRVKLSDASANKNANRELQTEIFIKLCIIKKLNRVDKIRHVFGKDTLSLEKQKCDSIKLSYQNLVYELHHLVAETNKCLAFKSKDEDIELVPFEEFMKDAPATLTNKFQNFDAENREQKHSLRLARLEWELTQRKSLAQLCKSLVEEQKKLGQDLVERKEKFNALRPLLLNIINATNPLQEHLDISLNELRVEHKLAFLLPDPLYIFYVNVVSYTNVYELNLTVEILGDQDEAVQWKEIKADGNLLNDDETDQELESLESEEVVEVKKRRHRKSVQQVDPMEEKRKKLLECHPLYVEVTAKLDNGPSVVVTFRYQTKLKIITVTSKANIPSAITGNTARDILSGENILSELIENDFGTESPNPITPYQLKKFGITSYQSLVPQIGHAYQWAQRVCGMDFLTKQMNCDKVGSTNVENVVKSLFKRLETRYDLANQLQLLEQNILPKLPASLDIPANPVSTLTKWSAMSYQKFCQSECTEGLVEEELISPSDLFYLAVISRGSANLQAFIVLNNNYPEIPPLFSLCLNYSGVHHSGNSDEIRDMERMLNLNWERGTASASCLLSAQITHLCSYLDIYLETTDPKTFPQKSTFIRNICARNRKRPFKFRKMGTGIFTQY